MPDFCSFSGVRPGPGIRGDDAPQPDKSVLWVFGMKGTYKGRRQGYCFRGNYGSIQPGKSKNIGNKG